MVQKKIPINNQKNNGHLKLVIKTLVEFFVPPLYPLKEPVQDFKTQLKLKLKFKLKFNYDFWIVKLFIYFLCGPVQVLIYIKHYNQ